MSQSEKNLLEANIKLVDDKNMLMKDIDILIRYLKGEKELKEDVKNIIKYYKKINLHNKVKVMR